MDDKLFVSCLPLRHLWTVSSELSLTDASLRILNQRLTSSISNANVLARNVQIANKENIFIYKKKNAGM